jgi:hypothetical protein
LQPLNDYTFVDSAYNLYRALPGWDSTAWPLTFYLHCVPNQPPVPSPGSCGGAQLIDHTAHAQFPASVTITVRPSADLDFTNSAEFLLWMFPDIRRDWTLHVSCMAGDYIPNVGTPFPRWIVLRAQARLSSSRVNIATAHYVTATLDFIASSDTVRVLHNGNWSDTTDRGSDVDNLIAAMTTGLVAFADPVDTASFWWGYPNGGPIVGFGVPVSNWHPLQFHASGHALVANSLCRGYSDTGDTNFVDVSSP